MGRELRRVPLDFSWPLNMTWKGYLNPYHSQECKVCERSGLNAATKKISDDWYGISNGYRGGWRTNITQDEVDALVAEGRLMDFTHTWSREDGWKPKNPPYHPTAAEVNAWASKGMGHDSINQWVCVKVRAQRLGVYGMCPCCDGEGSIYFNQKIKDLSDRWYDDERYHPPTGEGFQLWETTSEGSPCSPVFKTLDELCEWCEGNASTFGNFKTSKEEWKRMLNADMVCHTEGNMVFL